MAKFTVGDKVRMVGENHIIFDIGDIIYIIKFSRGTNSEYFSGDYLCVREEDNSIAYVFEKDIEPAERINGTDKTDIKTIKWKRCLKPKYLNSEFDLFNKKGNKMRNLSELSAKIRRTFNKDQKALWKAGYIDECGKWTEKAHEEAMNLACDNSKEELVQFANEEIELSKEENK